MKKPGLVYYLVITGLILFINTSIVYCQSGTYYNFINSSSPAFITDLQSRIRNPYTRISYDNFDETNIANFASINNGNGTRSVFCVYSGYEHVYSGIFTWGVMSREHTWAHSWAPTFPAVNTDQYADQYNLFPTHQSNANNRRSNHPLGEVINISYQFLEGKLGTNSYGQIVYEPKDEHKGDAVRALLYMPIKYDGIGGYSWNFNWLNNTKLPALGESPQDTNVLKNWHIQDPPDKWEVDRNNYIQSIQHNRNPFVDHPEYVSYINFNNLSKLNPMYSFEPNGYVSNFSSSVSENSIQLIWEDALGAQLPSGYLLIAYDKNNYFLPIDGSLYNNDANLSDGFAMINISYSGSNTYSFNSLPVNNTYYFTIYSFNGSGNQINYKIDGVFPQTNSTIVANLAPEPTNYVTNFNIDSISSTSIKLIWNDAVSGSQIPSGYLLVANGNNFFNDPSDGMSYLNDSNLADGNAVVNIDHNSFDDYLFNKLLSNTNYYFKIYSYNGKGAQINYKTDGSVPFVSGATSELPFIGSVLLDNFNRINNNILGNTMLLQTIQWQESETVIPSSILLKNNRIKLSGTLTGREFANINIGVIKGYPQEFSSSNNQLIWAMNMKQSRPDPSGFDNNNYGMAFIIGKTTSDLNSGNGYAIALGQSGANDALRLTKFTGGMDANSKFTNIISSGDYSNKYLSVKIIFEPAGNIWTLFVDSSSIGFPQSDPRNTSTQIGSAFDSTYTNFLLPYLGALWNHASSPTDSATFDDLYVPRSSAITLSLTALIEGYFENGILNKMDTMKVYLRNSVTPFNIIDSAKSILDSTQFTCFLNFCNAPSGTYYIVLNHRNSIETWSKIPQTFELGATTYYDFTTSQSKAYGDNLILKNGKYCIYSGDVNQDQIVDVSDMSDIFNNLSIGSSGYVDSDLNGDDFVDVSDLSLAYNNVIKVITIVTP